jgi:putative PIN family toxin of toxin-antitoxin system
VITALYDTNILISGTFWRGLPRYILHSARQGRVRAITCQSLLEELYNVLIRPNKPFRLSEQEAARVIAEIQTFIDLVEPTREVTICRDPSDNQVLACALSGKADYIVTGDPDLLTLKRIEKIQIVTAREFLDTLRTS